MKYFLKIIICSAFIFAVCVYSQDTSKQIEQVQWEAEWDANAEMYIRLKLEYDHLDSLNDSLNSIMKLKEDRYRECLNNLYTLIGATESDVASFRLKFDETEKKIAAKTSPDDVRKNYFDEITASKIRCLPEFSSRYEAMKKALDFKPVVTDAGTNYTVLRGDHLWKIAALKYSNPNLWPVIWDVNKNGVVNKDQITVTAEKTIHNPDLIYPGQILKIPTPNTKEFQESLENSKNFRKQRKNAKN